MPAIGHWRFGALFITLVLIMSIWIIRQSHAESLSESAQKSIVYISFKVTDPNTGAKSTIQGTGFVVSKNGFVLTAAHLFREWRKQGTIDKTNNEIKASLYDKPGFVPGNQNPMTVQVIDAGDPDVEDVALLEIAIPIAGEGMPRWGPTEPLQSASARPRP